MSKRFVMMLAVCGACMGAGGGSPLRGALDARLDSVIVYPNPFQPGLGHTAIAFDNLTREARVRIFKITGELIADITADGVTGRVSWDGTNTGGEAVASGIYVYLVTDASGRQATGKFALLR